MIDWTKPVQTRYGLAARVVATDLKGTEYPVVVIVTDDDGRDVPYGYTQDGSVYGNPPVEHDYDIINVNPTVEAARLDNNMVEVLAQAMKTRLKSKREQGFGGWNDPTKVSDADLAGELVSHLERGAWIGAANYLMFLYHREAGSGVMLNALHAAHTAHYPLV